MQRRLAIGLALAVGGGEGEEDVAGGIAAWRPAASDAERGAAGEALQLGRDQRRIGGDIGDDRAGFGGPEGTLGHPRADRRAGNAEPGAAAMIGLDQDADRVGRPADHDAPRGRAGAALPFIGDHAGAAADIALGHRAGRRGIDRRHCVGLGHMQARRRR